MADVPPPMNYGLSTPVQPRRTFTMAGMRAAHVELLQRLNALDDERDPVFLADVAAFQAEMQNAGATIAGPAERADLQANISFWQTIRIHGGERPDTIMLLPFDIDAALAASGGKSPYCGLNAFRIDDRESFFGRYDAVQNCVDIVRKGRFLAVLGLSGSGKSSLVRAGLIPELAGGSITGADGVSSDEWHYPDPILPDHNPLASLSDVWGPIKEPADLVRALDARGAPVVLTIDQFEEVFTLAESEDRLNEEERRSRQLFLNALAAAAKEGSFRHIVVITMRSEFDSRVKINADFSALFDSGRYNIGALSAGDLQIAIEEPAKRLGVGFEQGLVSALVDSVLGEPAGLPLLQFTLQELWERRDGGPMSLQVYADLGGNPRDILANAADRVYKALKLEQDKIFSQRIFLKLVTAKGLEATSRRIRRADLDSIGGRDNINMLLKLWRDEGMLRISPACEITEDSLIEVTHEALIRNWQLLVDWVIDSGRAEREAQARRWLRSAALIVGPQVFIGFAALFEWLGFPPTHVYVYITAWLVILLGVLYTQFFVLSIVRTAIEEWVGRQLKWDVQKFGQRRRLIRWAVGTLLIVMPILAFVQTINQLAGPDDNYSADKAAPVS